MTPSALPSNPLPPYSARPSLSSRPEGHEYTTYPYELKDGKDRSWLKLNIKSRAYASACLPHFFEGECMTGSVMLELEKETQVKAVIVELHGEIIATHNVRYTFLHVAQQLWSLSRASSGPIHAADGSMEIKKGKLRGSISWPFSLKVPAEVDLKFERAVKRFRLPPSFYMRGARVTIRYRISASVVRGMFQANSSIGSQVGYMPIIRPELPSLARQLAYQENTSLPGPDGDPDGWYSCPPVRMHGHIFSNRAVDARLTLSLAKPLSYPRGSIIPLTLAVECSDSQALDVLASPKVAQIRLLRILSMKYDSDCGRAGHTAQDINLQEVEVTPKPGSQDVVDVLQSAVLWEANRETQGGASKRILHGEIHLLGSLPPSSHLGHFRVSYAVALYPTRAVAFIAEANKKVPLRTVPIEIATVYPRCPRPISYSPPDYESLHSDAAELRMHDAVVYG